MLYGAKMTVYVCHDFLRWTKKWKKIVQTQASLFDYAKRLQGKKKERLWVNFERAWKLFFAGVINSSHSIGPSVFLVRLYEGIFRSLSLSLHACHSEIAAGR